MGADLTTMHELPVPVTSCTVTNSGVTVAQLVVEAETCPTYKTCGVVVVQTFLDS